MRVVLDTNLLVASLINTKSLGFALYQKWREIGKMRIGHARELLERLG